MEARFGYCQCNIPSPSAHSDRCINDGCRKMIKSPYKEIEELEKENSRLMAVILEYGLSHKHYCATEYRFMASCNCGASEATAPHVVD